MCGHFVVVWLLHLVNGQAICISVCVYIYIHICVSEMLMAGAWHVCKNGIVVCALEHYFICQNEFFFILDAILRGSLFN